MRGRAANVSRKRSTACCYGTWYECRPLLTVISNNWRNMCSVAFGKGGENGKSEALREAQLHLLHSLRNGQVRVDTPFGKLFSPKTLSSWLGASCWVSRNNRTSGRAAGSERLGQNGIREFWGSFCPAIAWVRLRVTFSLLWQQSPECEISRELYSIFQVCRVLYNDNRFRSADGANGTALRKGKS